MKRAFGYTQDFSKIDFRKQPERYQIGKGEQGVLSVEPYKSEILPHWRFKTPKIALESAKKYLHSLRYIKKPMILLVWIWHGSFFRWGTLAHVDMLIIKVVVNTVRKTKQIFLLFQNLHPIKQRLTVTIMKKVEEK